MLLTVPANILHTLLLEHGLKLTDIATLASLCTALHAVVQPLLDACSYQCSSCGHSIVHPKHVEEHVTGPLSETFGSPCDPGQVLPGVLAVTFTASSLQLQYHEERSYIDGQLRRVLAREYKDPAFHDPTCTSIRVQVATCSCCGVMLGLHVCSIRRIPSRPPSPASDVQINSYTTTTTPDATVPSYLWCQRVSRQRTADGAQQQQQQQQDQEQQHGIIGQVLLCMRALVFRGAPLVATGTRCAASSSSSNSRGASQAGSRSQVFKCQGKRTSSEALLSGWPTSACGIGCGNLLFTSQDVMGCFVAREQATRTLQVADLVTHLRNNTYKLDDMRTVKQMQGDDAQMADVRCAQCGEIIGCKLLKLDAAVSIQNSLRVGRFIIFQAATTAQQCDNASPASASPPSH